MPAKKSANKKGPSMRQNQQRKLQMQKIAKGGPQKSGVKKPVSGPTNADAKRWQTLNRTASAKAGKAAEPKPRTPAPGTGNVLRAAQQFSKDKAAKDREVRRQAATARTGANRQAVGKAMTGLASAAGGPKALAVRAVAETVAPRPTAAGTVTAAQSGRAPSRFANARDLAMKKASAIKGSPVVGPRKSSSGSGTPSAAKQFDSAFAAARKAGKSSFTWKGKKYTTKVK
jgi:hypothetical protein